MGAQKKVRTILAGQNAGDFESPEAPPFGPETGGEGGKRNIPKDFEYNPKALKPLARMLLSMSISLGHSLTAYREFTKLKSSNISPDGMVGGRGYILNVKEVRGRLQQACELISSVSDTIHDEINAPHWKPKIADLGKNDAEDISEFLEESKKIMDDPEGYADEELDELEEKNDGPGGTSNEEKSEGDPRFNSPVPDGASKMPGAGAPEMELRKTQEEPRPKFASLAEKVSFRYRQANSSLPVNTLPGGPRVDHLDREQTGPWGSYNTEEPKPVGDDWGKDEGVGNDYLYPSDSRMSETSEWGSSSVPDSNTDPTPGEANDFGLGYGAKGEASEGYGTVAPDGRGVPGPSSGLPEDLGGKLNERPGDSTPRIEQTQKNLWASEPWGGSHLPNDGEPPVARSDYFPEDRGNQFNVNLAESGMPGEDFKAKDTPIKIRPQHSDEHMFAESGLPGSPQNVLPTNLDMTPNVGDRVQDQAVPYVKWDTNTHNYRHDQQDFFSYDRNSDG